MEVHRAVTALQATNSVEDSGLMPGGQATEGLLECLRQRNLDRLYTTVPSRWGAYVFSDRVNTRLVRAVHGDSSGVRGAAWLWD